MERELKLAMSLCFICIATSDSFTQSNSYDSSEIRHGASRGRSLTSTTCPHILAADLAPLIPFLDYLDLDMHSWNETSTWEALKHRLLRIDPTDPYCERTRNAIEREGQSEALRKQRTRSVRKIFGVGLSKTGTSSLYMALRRLGLKGCHTCMVVSDFLAKKTSTFWNENRDESINRPDDNTFIGTTKNFLDAVDFTSDLPVALFYDELLSMYPNALFILTIRSVKSWIRSASKSFHESQSPNIIRQRSLGYSFSHFNGHMYPKRYIAHMLDVLRKIPCCQLLVPNFVEHGDAWDKLCPFIGRPIPPNRPFPAAKPSEMYKTIPTDEFGRPKDKKMGENVTSERMPFNVRRNAHRGMVTADKVGRRKKRMDERVYNSMSNGEG